MAGVALAAGVLGALPSSTSGQSLVLGHVLDADSGTPVPSAQVILVREGTRGSERRATLTAEDGTFRFEDPGAGDWTLQVRHLAWVDVERPLRVAGGGRVTRVAVQLHREVILLAPIAVSVDARPTFGPLVEVYDRLDHMRRLGSGRFWDRQELEASGTTRLTTLLQTMAGVRVQPNGAVILNPAPGRSMGASPCTPQFYLDGRLFRLMGQSVDDVLPFGDIEVVEVYRRASEIPAEYGGSDARCGVIAIWSRRGR